jgi:hypothetical protein
MRSAPSMRRGKDDIHPHMQIGVTQFAIRF